MALPNPNRSLITDELWNFGQVCLDSEPGSQFGGIYADKPGFHNTVSNNRRKWPGNYSIALPVLLQGPWDKARAFDWTFPEAQHGDFRRINLYGARLLAASTARDPRLYGLYEWFGTRDGANIGFNIWKDRPSSSDDSHDWHIHFSFLTPNVVTAHTFSNILTVLFPVLQLGDDDMFTALGQTGPKVQAMQLAIIRAGYDLSPVGGADGEYGNGTAAGLAALVGGDGKVYGPREYDALHVLAYKGSGTPGPQGPAGPQGPQGAPGDLAGKTITLTGTVNSVS